MVGISDNIRGFVLAISSSIFIGSSFIIKKKGLKRAGAAGTRASDGGYSYLMEPWWWAGMITMLAHFILDERLHMFGVVGCMLCLVGSTTIVLHAPLERDIESVKQVWQLATEPGFIIYTLIVLVLVIVLIVMYVPRYGQTHMVVYIGICSLMGSLTVMGVKAVAIALKLSLSGSNQFIYFETWFFTILVIIFCVMQLVYLNKALDIFNTAVVSPVYYVMFTTLTIVASTIMFKEWDSQNASQIISELCGFVTILSGTFLLHKTKDMGSLPTISSPPYHRSSNSSPRQTDP
ncbi:hypothetical protein DH2020_005086 [Rehmannia glutinosa]|uniref:Probable magnesium transporter n=1 Tax=Rehmannia glutinosa TaxID=99300 RepID=A0ABR0XRN1_REHGL